MRDTREEGRLREAFGRLRDEERRAAPAFDHIMNRSRNPPLPHRVERLRLAGAATAILLLALGILQLTRITTPGNDAGALAAELQRTSAVWRSPTDFLLEPSATRAWRGIPAIGRSLPPTAPDDPDARDRSDDTDTDDEGRVPS